jgi:hypothetical protein
MRGHHTDLTYPEGGSKRRVPFVLGHEAAGTVECVGEDVTAVAPGDFVIPNWRAVCGQCRACKRGRPWYCFDTVNAAQRMTLTDGTEPAALGIGAFAYKTLVHEYQSLMCMRKQVYREFTLDQPGSNTARRRRYSDDDLRDGAPAANGGEGSRSAAIVRPTWLQCRTEHPYRPGRRRRR